MNSEFLVKYHRRMKKITLVQMAEKLDICEKQYRRYEKDLGNIKMKTFHSIIDILDLSNIETLNLFGKIMLEMEDTK